MELAFYVLPGVGNVFVTNIGLLGTLLTLLSTTHFLICKPKMQGEMVEIYQGKKISISPKGKGWTGTNNELRQARR